MVILCPACWSETEATIVVCRNCGATVDLYSAAYERQLAAELDHCDVKRREKICWTLGYRGRRSAIPVLVELIHDPDLLVCEAAVRSMGEIGDPSAADAVKQIVTSENDSLRSAARYVLRTLLGSTAEL
jgi:HEAT repeat protein